MLVDYFDNLSHTTLYHLSYVSILLISINRPREAWEIWIEYFTNVVQDLSLLNFVLNYFGFLDHCCFHMLLLL